MERKKTMKISLTSKYVTSSGRYAVNWGTTGSSFNRNNRRFTKLTLAKKFVTSLVNKFSKKYNIRFTKINH